MGEPTKERLLSLAACPLRASASDIPTERILGCVLRLPEGQRTSVETVDRLIVIALTASMR
jgi:hypothetical protein